MKINQCNPHSVLAELRPLAMILRDATPNWLARTAWEIWQLEALGATHFGGADILAWWLVQRCQPKPPPTKAKIRKLQRMCGGSQKTLDLLVRLEQNRGGPTRLQTGWSFERLNSYVSILKAEAATA